MIEQREEIMVSPSLGVSLPILRKSHFLKPILNPDEPAPQKPHFDLPLPSINPKLVTKSVLFKGRIRVQNGWKDWVDNLKPTHEETWKKAGIFDAIRVSTYHIKRHDELLIWLAQKWFSKTNTFIFPWGETTITLEDVFVLGGFPVYGDSFVNPSLDPESENLREELIQNCSKFKKKSMTLTQLMKHFRGKGGELENAALIFLWLSRFVFSTGYCTMNSLFPVAASLARGTKIALGSSVLASIYRDMSLLREKIRNLTSFTDDGSKLVLRAPLQFLQVWAWERFPRLSPKPIFLPHGEPRLARWHDVKKPKRNPLSQIEFNGDNFVWRPYASPLKNWVCPKFYIDKECWVLMNSDVDYEFHSWARFMMACELVGLDSVEKYQPHRVGMQLGMDQDVPGFLLPKSDRQIDGLKVYLPHHLFQRKVTVEYSRWWRDVVPSFGDEAWTVYERRKRSVRQIKKKSDIVENASSEANEIDFEKQKRKKLKESHSNTLDEIHEFKNETEIIKEPPGESEMKSLEFSNLFEGHEQGSCKDDNVVIIDDDEEEDDDNNNPLEAIFYALQARIDKLKFSYQSRKAGR